MKKDKSDKSEESNKSKKPEEQTTLTAREAAQDFIRPFVMKGDILPLRPTARLRHVTENYSAHIEGENVVMSKLCGKVINELFPVSEIMRDIAMEHLHKQGMANITASTAKEAYAIRDKEVKSLMRILSAKLKNHRGMFKKNTRNWGYVGDMAHIQEKLNELIPFLQ